MQVYACATVFICVCVVLFVCPAGARRSRPMAARHQHGVCSKHARLCTSRSRYGRGPFEYRTEPVRRPRSSAGLRPNVKAPNRLKLSDSGPNIDRTFCRCPSDLYGRPVYELCDLKIRYWKIAELRAGFGALRTSADPPKSRRSPQWSSRHRPSSWRKCAF